MRTTAPVKTRAPSSRSQSPSKTDSPDRLQALARRCRIVSEDTVMPEIIQEMVHIAEALEDEANRLAGR